MKRSIRETVIRKWDRVTEKETEFMKKKIFFRKSLTAILLAFGITLTGCGSSGGSGSSSNTAEKPQYSTNITNLSENVEKISIPDTSMTLNHGQALSRSGIILLQKMMEQDGDKNGNYVISPISIQMALGMTASGSDKGSKTQKELMEVLMPGTNEEPSALNNEMASFAKRMQDSEDAEWHVANSVWVNNNGRVKLRDSFVKDTTNYYAAELYSAPFDASTVEAINQWVKKNTKERIPEIIKEISPEARIALVNALSFDGEWAEQYEEADIAENQTFHNADGTEAKTTMLCGTEGRAIKLAGGLGFIKPYRGYQYSFVGILPPEGMSTEEYLKKIASDTTGFSDAYLNADSSRDVIVKMPEFKTEYGKEMNDVLKALGVTEAYTDDAKFDAMVTDDSMPVKIGTVIHKSMIEVDRHGTKAAAATIVMMDEMGAVMMEEPYMVTLDRPFIYAVVDNETGVPVFLGAQNSME